MRAEGPHLTGYDPTFRVGVNEQASTNAGCRYLRRTRERRSSRLWTTGLLLLLSLTAVISIQFVSVTKAAILGVQPLSAESFGAIELSSCKLSGVPQPARCGVLEVPENPNRTAGRPPTRTHPDQSGGFDGPEVGLCEAWFLMDAEAG